MSEEIKNVELDRFEKIKNSLEKIKNKESKFMFCVTQSPNPAASIYEIYFHANVMKDLGYDVTILTDVGDYMIPDWIESNLTNLKHESLEKTSLSVGPEDVLVIPEIHSNIMEQTKNLPCIRIGLLQSIDYMLNGLIPGVGWDNFGIEKVITTSETLKNIYLDHFGQKYDVKICTPSIPDYFKNDVKLKKPVISIVGRNPNEIAKIVKLFYTKYPQFSWITFDSMLTESNPPKPLRRIDYANKLKNNFAAVWVDRISSFGTFPLECMKVGTIPIAIKPDITPEYIVEKNSETNIEQYIENSGVWTNDIYAIPTLIGDLITKFLDDTITDDIYKTMEDIVNKYTPEKSKIEVENVYTSILDERMKIFENIMEVENNKK